MNAPECVNKRIKGTCKQCCIKIELIDDNFVIRHRYGKVHLIVNNFHLIEFPGFLNFKLDPIRYLDN